MFCVFRLLIFLGNESHVGNDCRQVVMELINAHNERNYNIMEEHAAAHGILKEIVIYL